MAALPLSVLAIMISARCHKGIAQMGKQNETKSERSAMISGRTSSSPLNSLDIVLCLSLSLAFNKTADAVRKTAMRIRRKSPYEHKPKLARLARANDDEVLRAVFEMLDKTVALTSDVAPEAPRCHMKPMRFAGYMYYCQHCGHTKKRTLG